MSDETERRPNEDFGDYVKRLEEMKMRAVAQQKEREADALDKVGASEDDLELKVAARAKRAAAREFYQALEEMEGER